MQEVQFRQRQQQTRRTTGGGNAQNWAILAIVVRWADWPITSMA